MSYTVNKVIFAIQLLGGTEILVKLLVLVRVDNIGAILMATSNMSKTHKV